MSLHQCGKCGRWADVARYELCDLCEQPEPAGALDEIDLFRLIRRAPCRSDIGVARHILATHDVVFRDATHDVVFRDSGSKPARAETGNTGSVGDESHGGEANRPNAVPSLPPSLHDDRVERVAQAIRDAVNTRGGYKLHLLPEIARAAIAALSPAQADADRRQALRRMVEADEELGLPDEPLPLSPNANRETPHV